MKTNSLTNISKVILKILFTFLLFFNFFFLSIKSFNIFTINAQERAPDKKCLIEIRCDYKNENEAEQYIRKTYTNPNEPGRNINPDDLKAQTKNSSLLCTPNLRNVHSVKLFTDPRPGAQFPSNIKIYIAECLFGDGQTYGCTTMDSELDKEIFGEDMLKKFQENPNLQYNINERDKVGRYNEDGERITASVFTSNAAGKIPVLQWWSYTKISVGRRYYGFFRVNPQQVNTGTEGGIQNAMPSWPSFEDKDCATIAWDPEGRVFDAISLEPVPNAKVTILKAEGSFFFDPTVPNPVFTPTNGRFSFYVPNGDYKLKVEHYNYDIKNYPIENLSFINPNYQKIYHDIYTKKNEIIHVENKLEHRDIPLLPKKNYSDKNSNCSYETGCTYSIDKYFDIQEIVGNTYKIEIKQSHPLATVTVKKKEICAENEKETVFATFYTDSDGYLKKELPLPAGLSCFSGAEISPTNFRQLVFNTKKDKNFLTNIKEVLNYFLGNVFAENRTTRISLNPIFRYLEGYAYDKSGKILSNIKVGIYVPYSSFPYHITKTDDNGYFKIPTTNLPKEPYKIHYLTNEGNLITDVSLTKFVSQNINYLSKNKINLNQVVDEKGKVIAPTKISPTQTKTKTYYPSSNQSSPSNLQPSRSPSRSPSTNKTNLVLLTVLILLILIIAVATLLYFYYQKNRSQSQI